MDGLELPAKLAGKASSSNRSMISATTGGGDSDFMAESCVAESCVAESCASFEFVDEDVDQEDSAQQVLHPYTF